jgi:hypothetical protein
VIGNLQFDYEKKCSEFLSTHAYKIETANREHRALAHTTRDRLINAITAKKYRLNKEKEALEISDASALLLHPNQFSINNPSSPGGSHGKRSTRQRRDADDIATEGRKRKRNGGDDDGSPAPQRRAGDANGTAPIWQTDRLAVRKVAGPIYSIDKLFTDKELAMTYNTSALQAHKYLLTHKPRIDEHGHVISSPEESDSGIGEHEEDASDSVPSAPMMERNVSHATRSARGGGGGIGGANHHLHGNFSDNRLMGIEALANFDFPGNFERLFAQDPKLPPAYPSVYARSSKLGEYNTPIALAADDANADVAIMNALKQYDALHGGPGSNFAYEHGSRRILEAASHPVHEQRYLAWVQNERPSENEVRRRLGLPAVAQPERSSGETGVHHEAFGTPSKTGRSGTPQISPAKHGAAVAMPSLGGVSMSRQSSASGAPMSRSSSRQKGRATRAG